MAVIVDLYVHEILLNLQSDNFLSSVNLIYNNQSSMSMDLRSILLVNIHLLNFVSRLNDS